MLNWYENPVWIWIALGAWIVALVVISVMVAINPYDRTVTGLYHDASHNWFQQKPLYAGPGGMNYFHSLRQALFCFIGFLYQLATLRGVGCLDSSWCLVYGDWLKLNSVQIQVQFCRGFCFSRYHCHFRRCDMVKRTLYFLVCW